jgi:DNA invertase Pin-like site-specific DNA recombinase
MASRARAHPLRAALYARVSLSDERQDPAAQLEALQQFAADKGYRVTATETDRASAADLGGRAGWGRLMEGARQGRFDLLVVWKLDRAFRSTLHALGVLESLNHEGVGFVCVTQPIDTTSPSGRLLFTVLAAVAEIERELISERTKLGMARARAAGKRIGRPRKLRPSPGGGGVWPN